MRDENLNDGSPDNLTSVDDKEKVDHLLDDRPAETTPASAKHACSGISDCKECRSRYDHDAIFSKKSTSHHSHLMNFFRKEREKIEHIFSGKISHDEASSLVLPNNHRVRLSSSLLSLSSRYYNLSLSRRALIVVFVSLCAGFFGVIFLQNTGLYVSGLAGTSQGIARLVKAFLTPQYFWIYDALFWILIILINIPFTIFGYHRISRDFAILTLIYVGTSNAFGFALTTIPGMKTFVLVGPTPDPNKTLLNWHDATAAQLFGIFLAGVVYSQIGATIYTVLFTLECSSGGFDFISVWYSRKKHRSIAKVFTIINCLSMFFGTILGGYIAKCKDNGAWGELNNYMFSPNFLVSLIMIIFQGITLNLLFPRFKWARVDIYSNKTDEIRNILISDYHQHSLSIHKIIGGYSLKERQMITVTCLYFEVPRLLSLIRYVDENCLVVISDIKSLDGYVYIYAKPAKGQHSKRKSVKEEVVNSQT